MASESNAKSAVIRGQIVSATHHNDLEKLLKYVPLNRLKNVLNEEMEELDENKINKVWYNCCNLDTIIPDDIKQSILSFIPYSSSVPNVNKTFKILSEKNKANQMKSECSLFQSMVEKEFKFNHDHKVILHQNRNEFEINTKNIASYNKYNNLKQCINDNNTNDYDMKVFVYDGEYKLDFDINQKIAFIGMTNNIIFKLEEEELVRFQNNLYFENISFSLTEQAISIGSNSNIWMKQCKFKRLTSVSCIISMDYHKNHSLYLNQCEFVGMSEYYAIDLSLEGRNVDILGCRFENFGDDDDDEELPYIAIGQHDYINNINNINLKIVGNTFDLTANNNRVQVIAYNTACRGGDQYDEFVKSQCYTINNNYVIGDILQLKNPNKIYHFCY